MALKLGAGCPIFAFPEDILYQQRRATGLTNRSNRENAGRRRLKARARGTAFIARKVLARLSRAGGEEEGVLAEPRPALAVRRG